MISENYPGPMSDAEHASPTTLPPADHTDAVEDLTARDRDTESQVLARAVKWHSEHRVLLNGHKTVVFK